MTPDDFFELGLDDGRHGRASASSDNSYRLGYRAGSGMHCIPASKERAIAFMGADMALGMYEQNFAEDRDQLLTYAVDEAFLWALPEFLDRRGWLDADWIVRINRKVN